MTSKELLDLDKISNFRDCVQIKNIIQTASVSVSPPERFVDCSSTGDVCGAVDCPNGSRWPRTRRLGERSRFCPRPRCNGLRGLTQNVYVAHKANSATSLAVYGGSGHSTGITLKMSWRPTANAVRQGRARRDDMTKQTSAPSLTHVSK